MSCFNYSESVKQASRQDVPNESRVEQSRVAQAIACGVTMAWQCTVRYVSDLTVYMFGVLCLPAGLLLVWVQGRHLKREREDRQIDREKEEEGGNNRPERVQYQTSCFSVPYSVPFLLSTLFHVVFLFLERFYLLVFCFFPQSVPISIKLNS